MVWTRANDIRRVFREFKKFNSSAQRIPLKYLPEILKLSNEKSKVENIKLGEKESYFCNRSEGNRMEYYVTKYERNPKYREQAIKIHGLMCQICGFNFETFYGRLGEGYIEVHHKKPLYTLKEEIVPNPETDMICVCSNCHKMLHRHRNSIISPRELKTRIIEIQFLEQEKTVEKIGRGYQTNKLLDTYMVGVTDDAINKSLYKYTKQGFCNLFLSDRKQNEWVTEK